MKVGDLVRYINEDPAYKYSHWTAIVVKKIVKDSPYGVSTEYVKVVWQQDINSSGVIRAKLMEVVNESR